MTRTWKEFLLLPSRWFVVDPQDALRIPVFAEAQGNNAERSLVAPGLSGASVRPWSSPPVLALCGANFPRGIHRWLDRRGTSPFQVLEALGPLGAPGGLPEPAIPSRGVTEKGTGTTLLRRSYRLVGLAVYGIPKRSQVRCRRAYGTSCVSKNICTASESNR